MSRFLWFNVYIAFNGHICTHNLKKVAT